MLLSQLIKFGIISLDECLKDPRFKLQVDGYFYRTATDRYSVSLCGALLYYYIMKEIPQGNYCSPASFNEPFKSDLYALERIGSGSVYGSLMHLGLKPAQYLEMEELLSNNPKFQWIKKISYKNKYNNITPDYPRYKEYMLYISEELEKMGI